MTRLHAIKQMQQINYCEKSLKKFQETVILSAPKQLWLNTIILFLVRVFKVICLSKKADPLQTLNVNIKCAIHDIPLDFVENWFHWIRFWKSDSRSHFSYLELNCIDLIQVSITTICQDYNLVFLQRGTTV